MILETDLYISTQPAVCDLFYIPNKLTTSEQRHPPNKVTLSDSIFDFVVQLVVTR